MKVNRKKTQGWLVLTLMLGATALAACSGGGGGGGASSLRVIEFVPDGTDGEVFRDEQLTFTFSAPIDPTSVSASGLQVFLNTEVIQGRIEVDGRRIIWSPVVLPGSRNDYNPPNNPPINGLGFAANTRYTVRMVGNSSSSILSKNGRPLAATFQSTFLTAADFLPEEPQVPPTIRPGSSPIFDPPPLAGSDPFSPNPLDWPVIDPSEVSIQIEMSERIAPGSIDPFQTVIVRNITDIPGSPPAGVGEIAMMETRLVPEADRILIRNIVSLGDWPGSTEPYDFEVIITSGVTDLAGTPIESPIVFHFRTADTPGEPNYRVFTETFVNQDLMDPPSTSAVWGDGSLEGADVNQRIDDYIPTPQNSFLLPQPLIEVGNSTTPFGNRFQMKYDTDHIPVLPGESITGMAWSPMSNLAFPSVYRDVTMKLGTFVARDGEHFNPTFDENYLNPPTTVFRGDYTVPFGVDVEWVDWPAFNTDFEVDLSHPVVFEWDMPEGGDTFQLFRQRSNGNFQTHRQFNNGGSERANTIRENTQYNTRFFLVSKSSFAQSIPIDSGLGAADYDGFLIDIDPDRSGTRVEATWAPSLDGDPPVAFTPDINDADDASHLVWRLELTANPVNGAVPRVRSLSYAYVIDTQP